jgi:glycosyltransferase involved in cell wall biosynthesis
LKKKILHIITSIDNGGAENHLVDLISHQIDMYDVYLIFFKGNNFHLNKLTKLGVKVFKINYFRLNLIKLIINFFKIVKIYKNIRPDIIHCHLWISEIYGFILKFFYKNFILIITKHLDSYILEGSYGNNKIFNGFFIEKKIFQYSDHIIFITKAVKKFFLKKIKLEKKKYSVVYYGVDTKVFKKKQNTILKKKLNIDTKTYVIGCVARHVEQKNLDFVIKSFSHFLRNNPDVKIKLIMIGKGHLTKKLIKLAIELGVNNKVLWIRDTNSIASYYNIFDMICLTSSYEGLGKVLLEAIACEVPILATRAGGIPEIVKNKFNGYLINTININKFSNRIIDTINLSKSKNFKKNLLLNKSLLSLERVFLEVNKIYYNCLYKK